MRVRIDDRLMHGQVVEGWIKPLGIRSVLVVSDALAKDAVQPELMRMAAPESTEVHLCGVDGAAQWLKGRTSEKTLLLVASPEEALKVLRAGVKFDEANVGGLHAQNPAVQISPSLSLSAADWKGLKKLLEAGVRIEAQPLPTEPAIDLEDWIARNSTQF